MNVIQFLSTTYWNSPARSESKFVRSRIPITATASVARSATSLCSCSSAFGISSMMTTPTKGTNVASVSPQLSRNDFIGCPKLLVDEDDQDHGENGHAGEQQGGVLLHPAGLDVTEGLTGVVDS